MGIEPMIKVLQTLALPLGYAAFSKNICHSALALDASLCLALLLRLMIVL
jgi:hypothetical protein